MAENKKSIDKKPKKEEEPKVEEQPSKTETEQVQVAPPHAFYRG